MEKTKENQGEIESLKYVQFKKNFMSCNINKFKTEVVKGNTGALAPDN